MPCVNLCIFCKSVCKLSVTTLLDVIGFDNPKGSHDDEAKEYDNLDAADTTYSSTTDNQNQHSTWHFLPSQTPQKIFNEALYTIALVDKERSEIIVVER